MKRQSQQPKENTGRPIESRGSLLSDTECLILALLQNGLRNSYDFRSKAGISVGTSSPVLARLHSSGLVEESGTEQRTAHRYLVTPAGAKALKEGWHACLNSQPADIDSIIRVTYLAWTLGNDQDVSDFLRRADASLHARTATTHAQASELFLGISKRMHGNAYRWLRASCEAARLDASAVALTRLSDQLCGAGNALTQSACFSPVLLTETVLPAVEPVSAIKEETLVRALAAKSILTTGTDPLSFTPVDATDRTATGVLLSGQDYRAGESIFSQGDAADSVFYVQKGKVKLTVVNAGGKEAVVAILPAASFFGEGCLAGQPVRMSDAIAIQQSRIPRVTKQALAGLLHQDPEFAERFLTGLLTRNVHMESDLVDHLFNSSEKPRAVSPVAGRPQPGVHRWIDGRDLLARQFADEPV